MDEHDEFVRKQAHYYRNSSITRSRTKNAQIEVYCFSVYRHADLCELNILFFSESKAERPCIQSNALFFNM